MRIRKVQCAGNARCEAVAETLYPRDADAYIDTEGFDVTSGDEAAAMRGAKACPERIIFVIEGDEQRWPPVRTAPGVSDPNFVSDVH